MNRSHISLVISVLLLSLVINACSSPAPDDQPDLQATLAALYAEETAQAAVAEEPAAEQGPTDQAA